MLKTLSLLAVIGFVAGVSTAGAQTFPSKPITIITQVTGIILKRPPILRMSCSSLIAWMTEPEPRNSSALKKAWVKRWNIAIS